MEFLKSTGFERKSKIVVHGVTLLPEVAVDAEGRDKRVKLLRFNEPGPVRTIGLAWRRTSPRKKDFEALGRIVVDALGAGKLTARRAALQPAK